MDLLKLRALQSVRRFNFERCNRYQSVAEHSFFVAVLARGLAEVLLMPPERVGWAAICALEHDALEAVTGDLPYLVRRAMDPAALHLLELQAGRELGLLPEVVPPDVAGVVEYADALELAMYLKEERESGNLSLADIERETRGRLACPPAALPEAALAFAVEALGGPEEWHRVKPKEMHGGLKH